MAALVLLPPQPVGFPDPEQALADPDGLLAAGGNLTVDWLLEAYGRGIFPWFSEDDPHILWWSPKRRAVLVPGAMRVSRSLRKTLRNAGFTLSMDTCFDAVVDACAGPRRNADGTWITSDMAAAYLALHRSGFAHSVEVWADDALVGGLYGVSIGRMFFGESMFSAHPSASKVAFYALQKQLQDWSFKLIDCQIMNPHLASLGVTEISRTDFLKQLSDNAIADTRLGPWSLEHGDWHLNPQTTRVV
jgi:leucyl/phenylalanyl-tRNA--protein transferase